MGLDERMRQASEKKHFFEMRGQSALELKKLIQRITTTIIIGNLARFEQFFGRVWGHNLDKKSTSQNQWLKVWADARKEILDFSHRQVRLLVKQFENFNIERKN